MFCSCISWLWMTQLTLPLQLSFAVLTCCTCFRTNMWVVMGGHQKKPNNVHPDDDSRMKKNLYYPHASDQPLDRQSSLALSIRAFVHPSIRAL